MATVIRDIPQCLQVKAGTFFPIHPTFHGILVQSELLSDVISKEESRD